MPCPGSLQPSAGGDSWGGQAGAVGDSAGLWLPRQWLQTCQALQNFPFGLFAFAPRSCTPLQGFSQHGRSLGPCEGGPAQARLCCASSQTQGCIRDHGSSWGVRGPSPRGCPGGSRRGLAFRSVTICITAKEKVQKLLISVLLVQLIRLGVCFYQRAGLGTVAENLVKAF